MTNQAVVEVLPLHPATQPDDGEQPDAPVPVNLPVGEMAEWRSLYCRLMIWVAANPALAAASVVAGWFVMTRKR